MPDTEQTDSVTEETSTEETTEETTSEETNDEATEDTSTEETAEDESTDEADEPEGNLDDLPDWARKAITKANNDAAIRRKQLRDLEEKLTGAKTPEEVAELTKELSDSNEALAHSLALEKAKRVHKLTDEDDVFFKNAKPEDIEDIAKTLANRKAPRREPDPDGLKGGLTPGDGDDDPSDPGALAAKYGRKRR